MTIERPMFQPVVNPLKTATISVFPELPGATFIGDILDEDLEIATRLQAIRADYEHDLCQVSLWHEMSRMGSSYDEIAAAILNPATITYCVYMSNWRDFDVVPALIAVETASAT